MVATVFNFMMKKVKKHGEIKGISFSRNMKKKNIFQYVDNTTLIVKREERNI